MRLIERQHYEALERSCTDRRERKHCYAYDPKANRGIGKAMRLRFCMDTYEAPNKRGERPLVMQSAVSAEKWCTSRGKRLCREIEWESACEGPLRTPWTYGWRADGTKCNSGKIWQKFNAEILYKPDERAVSREVERLWQGEPSGRRPECATPEGVHDLIGNVEEWVLSRPSRKWNRTLIGGFWAKPWPGCRGANDAHEPEFRFYETGFRCCKDPR